MVTGLPRPIHDTDLQLALVFAQEGPHADPRMEAAFLLGAVSGLRCCELARLRWEDIEGGQARVIGKGSKERVVPLNAETVGGVGADRADIGVRARKAGSRRGRASRGAGLEADDANTSGVPASPASAHRLRHRAATEALRKCHDLRKVQTLLGHASVGTTAIYTMVDSGDLADIIVDVNTPSDQGEVGNKYFAPEPLPEPLGLAGRGEQ